MSNTKSNNGGTASEERKTPYDKFDPKKTQGPYGLDRKIVARIQKELTESLGGKKLTSLEDIYGAIGIEPEEHKTGDNTRDNTGDKERDELKEKLRKALGKVPTSLADIYGAIGIKTKGDSKKNREEGRE